MSEKNEARVLRGRTLALSDGSFEKAEYELTYTVPSGVDAATALKNLETCAEGLLAEFEERFKPSAEPTKPVTPPAQPSPAQGSLPPGFQTAAQEPTPELDPAYLDRLPWTPFQAGGGSWIFRDTPGAKALSEELAKQGGQITIGNYRYRVTQGRDREFINRIEVKK